MEMESRARAYDCVHVGVRERDPTHDRLGAWMVESSRAAGSVEGVCESMRLFCHISYAIL